MNTRAFTALLFVVLSIEFLVLGSIEVNRCHEDDEEEEETGYINADHIDHSGPDPKLW
jgi:hypothetical protein